MPRRSSSAGGRFVTSASSKRICPCQAGRSPKSALNTVDLPAPLGPMIETTCPVSTRRVTPLRISILP